MIERKDFLEDKRLTERFLRRKMFSAIDLRKQLKALPDLESELEYFDFADEEDQRADLESSDTVSSEAGATSDSSADRSLGIE